MKEKLERIIANDGLVLFSDCTLVVNNEGTYYIIPNTELKTYDIDNYREISEAELDEFCETHSSEIEAIYEDLCNSYTEEVSHPTL